MNEYPNGSMLQYLSLLMQGNGAGNRGCLLRREKAGKPGENRKVLHVRLTTSYGLCSVH